MNAIHLLASQPWVERLGSTLLHFLWQGALIAAIYAAARRATARPAVRYLLACAALALMSVAPLLTWSVLSPPTPESIAATFTAPLSAAPPATVTGDAVAFSADMVRALPSPILSAVVVVWFAGVIALWLRLLGGCIFAVRLRSRGTRPAPPDWRNTLERLKRSIPVSRPVRLLMSSLVNTPAVVGWLRPVILAPVGALAGLSPDQLEALLLHELAHIRRHDYLVNMLQSCIEALLFYHPAVWWISGHIRAERELCCDDMAVAITGDAPTYARALAGLAVGRLSPGLAATGGSLSHRIARLLGESRPAPRIVSSPGALAATIVLAITAFTVFGQSAARPKFEVASIKPATQQRFMMVRPLPGRLMADATVKLLMQNAYTAQPYQIVGGPAWIDSERYQIEAKAAGDADRAQLFLMLQSLLEDRFQLKIHRETRELPVYALVPAKNGLKLPAPKPGSCEEPVVGAPMEWAGGRMPPPGQTPALSPKCGAIGIQLQPAGAQMRGGKIAMPELVRMLSMAMGRSVIDKTGFTGLFDLQLAFMPDDTTTALPPPPPGAAPPLESSNPPIFTALQEQLGLRLESTKGPVEVIVVDHLEKPTAN